MLATSHKVILVTLTSLIFISGLTILSTYLPKGTPPYKGPMYFSRINCDGQYKDGSKPTVKALTQILRNHSEWLEAYPNKTAMDSKEALEDYRKANLCGADLTGLPQGILKGVNLTRANLQLANLKQANLYRAVLEETIIEGADFRGAFMDAVTLKGAYGLCVILEEERGLIAKLRCTNFQKANLIDADMRAVLDGANLSQIFARGAKFGSLEAVKLDEAILLNADFSGSRLSQVNLSHTGLENANLSHTHLEKVDLTDARLMKVNLQGAVLQGVKIDNAQFQPENIGEIMLIGTKGLSTIKFYDPTNLVKLRNLSKEFGLRNEQRAMTAALRKFAIKSDTPFENFLQTYIFGGFITDYGAEPLRSIAALFLLIPAFSLLYYFILLSDSSSSNIWKVWPVDSINREATKPVRPTEDRGEFGLRYFRLLWTAFYFSLLSAFHIGWRDLNVGSWITRLQFREYTIRATGWVRVTSGIQSLISVYLLALWLFTYFGTPFE